MGLFDWLFGGSKKEAHATMGAGIMESAPMSASGTQAGGEMHMQHSESMSSATTVAKDPVCGMDVNPEKAATAVYEGTTYYFCAPGCRKAFGENPTKYLGNSGKMEKGMHGHQHRGGCC